MSVVQGFRPTGLVQIAMFASASSSWRFTVLPIRRHARVGDRDAFLQDVAALEDRNDFVAKYVALVEGWSGNDNVVALRG
jgi:hypothetical protein